MQIKPKKEYKNIQFQNKQNNQNKEAHNGYDQQNAAGAFSLC